MKPHHNQRHGHTAGCKASRTWNSWRSMLSRCNNPKTNDYEHYGGRGISVCPAWYKFENFLADMGERPLGHVLDRVKTDGDYTPDNCRWLTPSQSCQNKRNNRVVTYCGARIVVAEAARRMGVARSVLRARMVTLKWKDIDVSTLAFKPKTNPVWLILNGEKLCMRHAARRLGLKHQTFEARVRKLGVPAGDIAGMEAYVGAPQHQSGRSLLKC